MLLRIVQVVVPTVLLWIIHIIGPTVVLLKSFTFLLELFSLIELYDDRLTILLILAIQRNKVFIAAAVEVLS